MGTPITTEQFGELLAGFERSWFKLEAQPAYAITAERVPLQRFEEDGTLLPPGGFGWWQDWLDLMSDHARRGHSMRRVRVLAEPPTPYQRYLLAVSHWHEEAGERIAYMPRGRAVRIGLPLDHDWSLFDNNKVVITRFTPAGEVEGRGLVTDAESVRRFHALRDLALRHASAAQDIAAA